MPKRNIPQAITIYKDNNPQLKAKKLYQICKGNELKEVIWWLQNVEFLIEELPTVIESEE